MMVHRLKRYDVNLLQLKSSKYHLYKQKSTKICHSLKYYETVAIIPVTCKFFTMDENSKFLKFPSMIDQSVLHLQDGATPLYIACQNGHILVIEQLIAAKADVNIPREVGAITTT